MYLLFFSLHSQAIVRVRAVWPYKYLGAEKLSCNGANVSHKLVFSTHGCNFVIKYDSTAEL